MAYEGMVMVWFERRLGCVGFRMTICVCRLAGAHRGGMYRWNIFSSAIEQSISPPIPHVGRSRRANGAFTSAVKSNGTWGLGTQSCQNLHSVPAAQLP